MAEQANVASIEALEDFRAALLRYRERTTRALDDVSGEIKRTREWLGFEKRTAWEGEVKRRQRRLEQVEAELTSAKLSALQDDLSTHQMQVRKARRLLEEAEEKLRRTKKWVRDFDAVVDPAVRPLESLRDRVSSDLPKALASLDGMIRALGEYAERAPGAVPPEAKPAEGDEPS